jgi:hypothetical protein
MVIKTKIVVITICRDFMTELTTDLGTEILPRTCSGVAGQEQAHLEGDLKGIRFAMTTADPQKLPKLLWYKVCKPADRYLLE